MNILRILVLFKMYSFVKQRIIASFASNNLKMEKPLIFRYFKVNVNITLNDSAFYDSFNVNQNF